MNNLPLGSNGLGFGCVSLTQHVFLSDALKILTAAFHEGISHYDTALLYGGGYSERILGVFIKNIRQKVTIATKCGLGSAHQASIPIRLALPLNAVKNKIRKPVHDKSIVQPQPIPYRVITLEYIMQSLAKSLKNLQTDYIDFYLLHEALPSFLTPDACEYLMMQREKGVIRELGIAGSYVNLFSINSNELTGFNILQYENGPHYKSDELLNIFPEKKHFYHSTLKSLPLLKAQYSKSELAGILLSRSCKINPFGKTLFSTTNIKRLKENIRFFIQYRKMSLDELNSIYSALH